jgi:hypothetical protein
MTDKNKLYDFTTNSVVPASDVKEDGEYVLFPPGEYAYQVIGFVRTRKDNDRGKIPNGAWGAKLTFLLTDENGETTTVEKTFWLVQNMAWLAGKMLRSCRLRKEGEGIDFGLLELAKQRAATGRLKLKNRTGTGKYEGKFYNEIEDFIIPVDEDEATATPETEPQEEEELF